ncbi:hypothetical protein BDA96_07G111000 [Sorghum bicolor]|uniref:Uncharacterized protein n=1 Tax=Sorghum bicolor TaxID=4558 RepID=A0A921QKA4_SORBI|nr:hypothetical protein BDA96_07G111000 [Sorghum bicolor]
MDPPPAEASRRGAAGRGGNTSKTRGRLGLKKASARAPSPPPGCSSPAAPTPSPTAPTPTPTAPTPTHTAPAAGQAPGSLPAPIFPLQGARWGSIPPNFAQDPNSWYV